MEKMKNLLESNNWRSFSCDGFECEHFELIDGILNYSVELSDFDLNNEFLDLSNRNGVDSFPIEASF